MVGESTTDVEEKGGRPESAAVEQAAEGNQKSAGDTDRQRTPLDVISEVLWQLTQSTQHKFMFLADMEWYFLPPFRHRQFRVFHKDKAPIAFVSWAYVSDEVEERLSNGMVRLRPEEWRSGKNLWLIDLVAPFGGGEILIRKIKDQVFNGQKIKTIMPGEGGRPKVVEL